MIEQPPPPGCSGPPYLQMHLASAPVTLIMNNPNYTALLAFCEGNLKELSGLPNSKVKGDDDKKQNTTFNSDFRFGPPIGIPPTFRMTLDIPEFVVSRCHAAKGLYTSKTVGSLSSSIVATGHAGCLSKCCSQAIMSISRGHT